MTLPMVGKRAWLSPPLLIVLAALSLVAALVGLGSSYRDFLTPRSASGQFIRIHGDGWIEQGASVKLPELAQWGNQLDLTFNPWRPPGLAPAQLSVHVCGMHAAQFEVTADNPNRTVSLAGACDPRTVTFEVHNPFVPSESDQRLLGAQLVSARVSSHLGVPIVGSEAILSAWACIFSLAVLIGFALRSFGIGAYGALCGVLVTPLIGWAFLSSTDGQQLTKLFALWVFASSACAGMLIASRTGIFTPWPPVFTPKLPVFTPQPPEGAEIAPKSRSQLGWLALLCMMLGAALRFYGLTFGLPNNFHPDEAPKVNAVMRMVASGTLNPDYFLHPSLLLYLTYFVNTVFHWFGIPELLGMSNEVRDSAYLAGRTVSALAGTLSIWWVYLIGKRLFGAECGVLAAALLAVLPLHVTCSRYLKEDALLTCMLLACAVAVIKAVQEDKKSFLLLSGFLSGVSASSKYSGVLALVFVMSAPWLRSRKLVPETPYIGWTLLALALAPLGFVLCTPYSVIAYSKFIQDFSSEKRHMLRGHTIPIDAWSQFWMYHFWRSIIPGTTLFTAIVSVMGLGLLVWRRRVEDLFIVGALLMFYLPAEWVKAKPEPQPERYIFPCLPFLAIAAAEFVRVLRTSHLRLVVPVILVCMIGLPARRSLQLSSELLDDTRLQMADWMVQNLAPHSKVYLDWKPYSPRFWNEEFQVENIPRNKILENLEVGVLEKSGFDYLVLSSLFYERYFTQPLAEAGLRHRLREVFDKVPIVKEFSPRYGTYGFNNPTLTLFSLKQEDFARLSNELEQKRRGELQYTSNEMRASFRRK